ncbi:phosphoglucosamine mutase [Saccharophagus degradans]|uniref:Phosphoglucosamine mutase n=1 Tax=Saccharophagus degradans TaxID=86304 RepID=A0AAW7X4M2_9GAMM|nr:phosphoglucosamine mutase [Saccharophagus degradans]MDO6422492.1 phosphoglucosamine mutase [Saccharophagus degradans]MDO6606973.1 phosphoglucosamine mutase [Saccharophagus degradans]
MARKYFGTDGIRGLVGEGVITPQFFLQLGWAVGKVLAQQNGDKSGGLVLIGKDTRISGYMFESALEAGLISAGVDVGLLGPMPTPAIAYLTRTFQASAGIVISASHNPYTDNGIKLFNTDGTKLPDEVELAIEDQLDRAMTTASKLGKARRIADAEGRYIEFCKGSLPWGFNLRGLNIVVDCANGATYEVAPKVFGELGANVIPIANKPDGLNINLDCGSTKLNQLQKHVLETGADMGIAFDGDGDRVMFVDEKGEVLDGDQLLFIIASHKHKNGGCSGVVGTLMSNFGFELGLKNQGIPFERAKVGDRYVIEAMKNNGWQIGGESSGHIVCSDVTTTGDGIIAALQVLLALKAEKQSLHQLKLRMQKMPQVMINVRVTNKVDLDSHEQVQTAIASAEKRLDGKGRVLLRASGTEPVIRVMVEGQEHQLVASLAQELADIVGEAVA